ncbi:MAG: hypothetical protein EBY49_10805, partial [Actinobacteria bacterium]|nr:hypothetical protein [Actinomycetota bacterium]
MARDRHQLTTVVVGDEPDSWATAGFTVHDDRVRIGSTTIVCDPRVGHGIAAVGIDGLIDSVDGLPIGLVGAPVTLVAEHHNRVTGFDHLVAMSPSIDRTADALIDAGLQRRRTRRFEMGGEVEVVTLERQAPERRVTGPLGTVDPNEFENDVTEPEEVLS